MPGAAGRRVGFSLASPPASIVSADLTHLTSLDILVTVTIIVNMRSTKQRQAVKDAVCRLGSHPCADAVYEEVRREMPGISLGTVYRNLRLLIEAGEIGVIDSAGAASCYDASAHEHYHFRCERCGRLLDVNVPVDHGLDRTVEEMTGLRVRCHVMEFRGLCFDCQIETNQPKPSRDFEKATSATLRTHNS